MTDIAAINRQGQQIERQLLLRTAPVAVRFLSDESQIPSEALRPKRDRGYHLAQCQAFAMTRRQRITVAMLKEDHWCWAPLMAFGMVPFEEKQPGSGAMVEDPEAASGLHTAWPHFEYGKCLGVVSSPLSSAAFEPDVVLIYSNTAQMRTLMMALKYKEGRLVESRFDPIDSCVFSTVPTVLSGDYRLTLPDPGEFERAMAGEDEIILSVPPAKLETLVSGLTHLETIGTGYPRSARDMRPDFPRPRFYRELFAKWGLDA
jgi:uncharacterized protein (DUF169 family)